MILLSLTISKLIILDVSYSSDYLIFYPSKSVQKLLSTSERRFYPQMEIRDGNWNCIQAV